MKIASQSGQFEGQMESQRIMQIRESISQKADWVKRSDYKKEILYMNMNCIRRKRHLETSTTIY